MSFYSEEVASGRRFEFGSNWLRFLEALNEERVNEAGRSLQRMLKVEDLNGKTFIDVGSGSGLFSLSARLLGARTHSFDYDPDSVACTRELKRRYFAADPLWTVEQGSALDNNYLKSLGRFDIVYSWGVLHHTGAMWQALENIASLVSDNGRLFISIYNDQGRKSRLWKKVKALYNKTPRPLRFLVLCPAFVQLRMPSIIRDSLRGAPLSTWRGYVKSRGMTPWRDVVDWVGGYPFEVAKPEELFYFYKDKGFILTELKTCGGGLGCNEFIFEKAS